MKVPQMGPSIEEALTRVRRFPTIDVPDTQVLTGLGEWTVRRAIASGEIKSVRLGRSIRVVSAALREQFGIDE